MIEATFARGQQDVPRERVDRSTAKELVAVKVTIGGREHLEVRADDEQDWHLVDRLGETVRLREGPGSVAIRTRAMIRLSALASGEKAMRPASRCPAYSCQASRYWSRRTSRNYSSRTMMTCHAYRFSLERANRALSRIE